MQRHSLLILLTLALTTATLHAQAIAPAANGPDPSMQGVTTREVKYKHDGVELVGYLAYPEGAMDATAPGAGSRQLPGVLVLPEWWGLNDYAKMRARQVAQLGYIAFAADMYGEGETTKDPEQAKKWAGPFYQARDLLRGRAAAAVQTMRSLDDRFEVGPVAAIGYCFGGTAALDLAYSGADLAGVVSIHGGVQPPRTPDEAKAIKADILILHGDADPMVKDETLGTITDALDEAGKDWTLIRYSGAKHAFSNPDADSYGMAPVAFNERAAKRSWEHMKVFLADVLKGPAE